MYLHTNEESEVVNAMEMAVRFAENAFEELHLWRWIIIALHNAAQGVMVLSLRHQNGFAFLNSKSHDARLEAQEKGCVPLFEKLDTYLNLYEKVKRTQIGQVKHNMRFIPFGTEGNDIKRLNSLRNDFIHFTPKGWSLEVDGLPKICLSAVRMISFLALNNLNFIWYSEKSRASLIVSLSTFSKSMNDLHTKYALCINKRDIHV
jgi:hypothetical protein